MIFRGNSPLPNFGHLLGFFDDIKIAACWGIRERAPGGRGHTHASWPAGAFTGGGGKLAAAIGSRLEAAALYLDLRLSDDGQSEMTLKEEVK